MAKKKNVKWVCTKPRLSMPWYKTEEVIFDDYDKVRDFLKKGGVLVRGIKG